VRFIPNPPWSESEYGYVCVFATVAAFLTVGLVDAIWHWTWLAASICLPLLIGESVLLIRDLRKR